jgi:hypothetical protein
VERGRPPGINRAEAIGRPALGLRRRRPALGHDVDLVVVDDQREPVALAQGPDHLLGRLANELDLPPAHRSRPVENEPQVDGRTLLRAVAERHGQMDEDVAVAPRTGADQPGHRTSLRLLLEDLPSRLEDPVDGLVLLIAERSPNMDLDVRR